MEALKKLKEQYAEIAGGWNGEDDSFTVGGEVYSEEDAHLANEIVGQIEALEKLLIEFGANQNGLL